MFCFFKQKTAYEMRISDWSSDVCSSDLSFSTESAISKIRLPSALRRDENPSARPPGPANRSTVLKLRLIYPKSPMRRSHTRAGRTSQRKRNGRHCRRSDTLQDDGRDSGEGYRPRSEERRGGKECVSRCSFRWAPSLSKKNKKNKQE